MKERMNEELVLWSAVCKPEFYSRFIVSRNKKFERLGDHLGEIVTVFMNKTSLLIGLVWMIG